MRPLTAHTVVRLLLDTDPYLSCDECFARMDEYVERRVLEPGYEPIWMGAEPAPRRPSPC